MFYLVCKTPQGTQVYGMLTRSPEEKNQLVWSGGKVDGEEGERRAKGGWRERMGEEGKVGEKGRVEKRGRVGEERKRMGLSWLDWFLIPYKAPVMLIEPLKPFQPLPS